MEDRYTKIVMDVIRRIGQDPENGLQEEKISIEEHVRRCCGRFVLDSFFYGEDDAAYSPGQIRESFNDGTITCEMILTWVLESLEKNGLFDLREVASRRQSGLENRAGGNTPDGSIPSPPVPLYRVCSLSEIPDGTKIYMYEVHGIDQYEKSLLSASVLATALNNGSLDPSCVPWREKTYSRFRQSICIVKG